MTPCGVRTSMPAPWANCWIFSSYSYRNPMACVSFSIESWGPVKKCQPAAVSLEIVRLFLRRQSRSLPGVEAHGDDVEFATRLEIHHAERGDEPVQHLRAEHRALVIHESKDHRTFSEEL